MSVDDEMTCCRVCFEVLFKFVELVDSALVNVRVHCEHRGEFSQNFLRLSHFKIIPNVSQLTNVGLKHYDLFHDKTSSLQKLDRAGKRPNKHASVNAAFVIESNH